MTRIRALIVAAGELLASQDPPDPGRVRSVLGELARQGLEVWAVGLPPAPAGAGPDPGQGPVRAAASLEEAAARLAGRGPGVLVVGARPSGSVRLANRMQFSSVLILGPDPQAAEQPDEVEDAPDFVVASLEDLPGLVQRMEREEADFEGTE